MMKKLSELCQQGLIEQWTSSQLRIAQLIVDHDFKDTVDANNHSLVGGLDISYFVNDTSRAYVTLIVLRVDSSTPSNKNHFETLYSHSTYIPKISFPYVPGFLAFREVDHLVSEVNLLKLTRPDLMPKVFLVDGNGQLHPRLLGLASHLGYLIDLPTIGVAKNPYIFDKEEDKKTAKSAINLQANQLSNAGDTFNIVHPSTKEVIGVGLRATRSSTSPIYISVGHKVSLETATGIVYGCCLHRVPEPIRQADIVSRECVRLHRDK
ncbi:Endonuclease V [Halotydeus destructor]|nr:Endonuclease V [Halotydeus destructor]